MKKLPYVTPGDGPNHPLNKNYINHIVYVSNALANLKVRFNGKDYAIKLSDDGSYIDMDYTTTGSITIIQSGSFTGSFGGGGSDVWQ